jgi:mannose-1-phosphate guanylyltransferase
MLEHTLARAEGLIPAQRLFTVANRGHLGCAEAREQLFKRSLHNLVLQPINKDTAAGVLLPLMHLVRRYPEATVAVFPSDHFILHENRFLDYVDAAFEVVEQAPSQVVLLGIEPHRPEPEYGYIVPDDANPRFVPGMIGCVASFVEKPPIQTAVELISRGALWNTMVIVFKAKTFLGMARLIAPGLYRSFQRIHRAIGTAAENQVVENCYDNMAASNLSKDLLEPLASHYPRYLNVLSVCGVFWCDWGSESRIIEVLRQIGGPNSFNQHPISSLSTSLVSPPDCHPSAACTGSLPLQEVP